MNDNSINSFLSVGQNGFAEFTHGSLFSGIGGFDLAAEWMGWTNIFHCEWNSFAQKLLKQHFPDAITYGDITKTDFTIHRGAIDILTGGFPCQPYSVAGKRKGKEDERHLWPEMLRAIREIAPRYVVGENVAGLLSWNEGLVFHEVQTDLENEGYEVQPFILPACAVNAPHRRDRVWFIAHSISTRTWNKNGEINNEKWSSCKSGATSIRQTYGEAVSNRTDTTGSNAADSENIRLQGSEQANRSERQESNDEQFNGCCGKRVVSWEQWPTQPPICGRNDGVSNRLDRIKALGNAIVPQVALQIFKAILIADRQKRGEKTINTVNYAQI